MLGAKWLLQSGRGTRFEEGEALQAESLRKVSGGDGTSALP